MTVGAAFRLALKRFDQEALAVGRMSYLVPQLADS